MRIALATLLIASACYTYGQGSKERPLREALDYYQEDGTNFSYDAELIGLATIEFAYEASSLDSFLKYLSENTPIQPGLLKEKYYSLTIQPARYSLTVKDSMDNWAVLSENIIILVNNTPVRAETAGPESIEFEYQPKFEDRVSVFAWGFQTTQIPLSRLLSSLELTLTVSPEITELSTVVVEDYMTKGISLEPADQSIRIAVADLPLLPGETDGDLFASLAALPGVTTPDNRPGNLFIRGSSTDQSLILFDDIPIYHRGHYYGTISPYNPKMVQEVHVYRNGFHPRFGGRVGGAVEINSSEQLSEQSKAGIGTNTLYGIAYAKVPLEKQKLGLAVSGRKSYPISFESPKLDAISQMVFAGSTVIDSAGNFPEKFEVDFQDYTVKAEFAPTAKNHINLTGIYAATDILYDIAGPRRPERSGFKNLGLNAKWTSVVSGKWTSDFSITTSDYDFSFRVETPGNALPNTARIFALNSIRDISVSDELSATLNPRSTLDVGAEYKYQVVSYDYSNRRINETVTVVSAEKVKGHSLSPFFNLQFNPVNRLFLQAGARSTYYSPLKNIQLEPRFSLNYDLTGNITLKGSAGTYYQYLSQAKLLEFTSGGFDNEVWLMASKKTARMIHGVQTMAGTVWSKNSMVFDVESYFKTAENITYYTSGRFSYTEGWTTADHEMYGVDLFLKKQFGEHISVWTGYTYSQIKIQLDTAKETTYNSKYSQPHSFYVGGSVIRRPLKVSVGWKYASGLYARSIDIKTAEKAFLQNGGQQGSGTGDQPDNPFIGLPNRFDPVHMLDVSISCNFPKKERRPFESTFGLSVINLYNQTNLTDQVFRAAGATPDLWERKAMKFAPNLMVMIEF